MSEPTVPSPDVSIPKSNRLALSLNPFSPVPLAGPDAFMGWGRLALYGALAYMTWKGARKVSYAFTGAAFVSAITSISAKAWDNGK